MVQGIGKEFVFPDDHPTRHNRKPTSRNHSINYSTRLVYGKNQIRHEIVLKKIISFGVFLIMAVSLFFGCGPENKGHFYSLKEAYDKGLLTQDELKSLAYYYNDGSDDEDFVPKLKVPEILSNDTEKRIKETYLSDKVKKDYPNATISGIRIIEYYGVYNDCIAVFVVDEYRVIDVRIEPECMVGDVLFRDFTFPGLEIWCENPK